MNPPVEHRQLTSSHATQRLPAANTVRQQALRARATVADVLGRDPKREVLAGGTRLIDRTKRKS